MEGEAPKVGPPSVEPTGESELEESEIDRLVAERYPFPKFQSLESVVGNWREVPQNAYPEVVTLKKPVELELKVNGKVSGKSTLRVGQQAYPVKLDGNVLTVSGAPGALTMQGSIGLDETDFKERVRRRYEDWKTRQEGRVHKLRKEEKQRLLAGSQAPAETPPAAETSGPGEKPEVNLDGIIPLMVESIRAGEVKEIQLDRIDYWKWIGYEEIGGTGYWTGWSATRQRPCSGTSMPRARRSCGTAGWRSGSTAALKKKSASATKPFDAIPIAASLPRACSGQGVVRS